MYTLLCGDWYSILVVNASYNYKVQYTYFFTKHGSHFLITGFKRNLEKDEPYQQPMQLIGTQLSMQLKSLQSFDQKALADVCDVIDFKHVCISQGEWQQLNYRAG